MKGLDIQTILASLPDVPLDQARKAQIEALIVKEVRTNKRPVGLLGRASWIGLATATALMCTTTIIQGNIHEQHNASVSRHHVKPVGWASLLANWHKFGQQGIGLPTLPFQPTSVTSSEGTLQRGGKLFTATFEDRRTGDFLIFYADNSGRPLVIENGSVNVGLSKARGVYWRMGGLQILQWKYRRYLCSIQVGRGFKGSYTEKDLMAAKPYLNLHRMERIADSAMR